MLEKINTEQFLSKKQYKSEINALEKRMAALQEKIKEFNIPVILAFEGWSASGKGTLIARLVNPLDPRYFNVYTMGKINEEAVMRPFLWPYWIKTPSKGRISIFDKSWHRLILPECSRKLSLSDAETGGFYYDVKAFEKQLQDDGALIVKLFLHISKEEQRKRFRELEKNEDTKWRVDTADWEQNRNYDHYMEMYNEMLSKTVTADSPWFIIEAADKRFAIDKIYRIIIKQIEEEIEKREDKARLQVRENIVEKKNGKSNVLTLLDLSKTVSNDEYKARLEKLQEKISEQGYKLYSKRRSVVIVYEGWDAAGKGGNIKRVTEELDPRSYEVVPISVPTSDELVHHYLWRFYNKLPKDGHIAIFDRSWYGRVLVERIEKLTPVDVWERAYQEINDMESHLANHGTIIFKFWMQIDKEEQLTRFKCRQADPLKLHKITDEDWRNREKWDEYEYAVEEMLAKTNTGYAPWTVIESNCKKYARLRTLEILTGELEKRLR